MKKPWRRGSGMGGQGADGVIWEGISIEEQPRRSTTKIGKEDQQRRSATKIGAEVERRRRTVSKNRRDAHGRATVGIDGGRTAAADPKNHRALSAAPNCLRAGLANIVVCAVSYIA
jgi:hypothetical protein